MVYCIRWLHFNFLSCVSLNQSTVPTFRSKALMELEMGKSGEMENDAERNLIMSLMRAGCDGQNCQSWGGPALLLFLSPWTINLSATHSPAMRLGTFLGGLLFSVRYLLSAIDRRYVEQTTAPASASFNAHPQQSINNVETVTSIWPARPGRTRANTKDPDPLHANGLRFFLATYE